VRVYDALVETETALTVGAVARLAGVTVRTLHHYDDIGLVSPDEHTDAGYRLYSRRNIERLQEVLFFRELGLSLSEIRRIVQEPGYRRGEALESHRELLLAQSSRLLAMVDVIDRAINAEQKGVDMTAEEMLEVFGGFDPAEHQAAAEERWGGTDAYSESNRRVSGYTKQMRLAEEHRAHITKWFYDCTPEIHAGLGSMYVTDSRFKDNIDKAGDGLAQYLSDAIAANHQRAVLG